MEPALPRSSYFRKFLFVSVPRAFSCEGTRFAAAALNTYSVDITYLETPFVYWPMVQSSLGIIGACLSQIRPLFAGAALQPLLSHLEALYCSVKRPIVSSISRPIWGSSEMKSDAATGHSLAWLPRCVFAILAELGVQGYWPYNRVYWRSIELHGSADRA